ncbi:MAG: ATP-binding cassette domain-containing protein [Thermoplasmatota archaeon]
MTLAVETRALTRRFDAVVAVDAIDLAVEAGECFALLGPNGAGKTTAIKMLTTLLPPTSGEARVAGFDVAREPRSVRRTIGYVPQVVSADGALTGRQNLEIFSKLYDIPRAERRARIDEALAFMNLGDAAERLARTYSGGMVRRLEIAQSLLHAPSVLFLDEPTLGLDPVARQAVWTHLRELRRANGTTIILTTHYMDEADALTDRIAIMSRGRVAALGSARELRASVGKPGATLDDAFAHYTGAALDNGGDLRESARTRSAARRLG